VIPEHEAMLARLQESGELAADWRSAFTQVARHDFLPGRIWIEALGGPAEVHREREPELWMKAAYAERPVAVQLEDGGDQGTGYVSSSASAPGVVARMLRLLDLEPGMRVLEIGTGTGYNAALLSAFSGSGNVTTVEVDPAVAADARSALKRCGFDPVVVVGDGLAGCADRVPFDRIIATLAVQRIPHAWVKRARPGAVILTPWGTAFCNGALARLTVDEQGRANGGFEGPAAFMWARAQRTPHAAVEDRVRAEHEAAESTTELHPHEPVADFDAAFTIGLHLTGVMSRVVFDGDAPGAERFTVYLMDPEGGSWASWRVEPGLKGRYPVRQHGRRRLFTELEAAYRWWVREGRPEHGRYGITVSREAQTVWLDEPSHVVGMVV
jgi:protein-L-isoaspartate(D-aspartate) O-methyltransferase